MRIGSFGGRGRGGTPLVGGGGGVGVAVLFLSPPLIDIRFICLAIFVIPIIIIRIINFTLPLTGRY